MKTVTYKTIRAFEGQPAILRTTEEELMRATILHVDREHEDVVLEILETDRPERYLRMGRAFDDSSWVVPFTFIREIRRA